jgi:D-glycero-D-manno-heptose 1,7-bisphosphate phosphatase
VTGRAAAFLDRDGTIVHEKDYLSDPEGVELIPRAIEAMKELQEMGLALVIVTNQSGIARGRYSVEDYYAVAAQLGALLEQEGVVVEATYYCPHHPDISGPCSCRKPALGMYEAAAADLSLDLASSYFVGDKRSDVEAADALNGRGILVRTGYGIEHEKDLPDGVWVADDLGGAADLIRDDLGR